MLFGKRKTRPSRTSGFPRLRAEFARFGMPLIPGLNRGEGGPLASASFFRGRDGPESVKLDERVESAWIERHIDGLRVDAVNLTGITVGCGWHADKQSEYCVRSTYVCAFMV